MPMGFSLSEIILSFEVHSDCNSKITVCMLIPALLICLSEPDSMAFHSEQHHNIARSVQEND